MDRVKYSTLVRQTLLNISSHVREERKKRNWDTTELAVRSGLSMTTIYNLEANIAESITLKNIVGLSIAFDMDMKELMS